MWISFQNTEGSERSGGSSAQEGRSRRSAGTGTARIHQRKREGDFAVAGRDCSKRRCLQILILSHWRKLMFAFIVLQEEVKNFITMENLDERIEEALDSPKNYNFAVDKEGRVAKQTALQWNNWLICEWRGDARTSCWLQSGLSCRIRSGVLRPWSWETFLPALQADSVTMRSHGLYFPYVSFLLCTITTTCKPLLAFLAWFVE